MVREERQNCSTVRFDAIYSPEAFAETPSSCPPTPRLPGGKWNEIILKVCFSVVAKRDQNYSVLEEGLASLHWSPLIRISVTAKEKKAFKAPSQNTRCDRGQSRLNPHMNRNARKNDKPKQTRHNKNQGLRSFLCNRRLRWHRFLLASGSRQESFASKCPTGRWARAGKDPRRRKRSDYRVVASAFL